MGIFDLFNQKKAPPPPPDLGAEIDLGLAVLTELALQAMGVGPDDAVLEIGFSQDWALRQLMPLLKRGRYAGLDTDARAIASAAAEFPSHFSHFKADFREGVVSKIPYPASHFTRVFTLNTVGTWLSVPKGLSEIFRVLSPGGRVALGFLPSVRQRGHVNTATELKRLLGGAGFADMQVIQTPHEDEGWVALATRP